MHTWWLVEQKLPAVIINYFSELIQEVEFKRSIYSEVELSNYQLSANLKRFNMERNLTKSMTILLIIIMEEFTEVYEVPYYLLGHG